MGKLVKAVRQWIELLGIPALIIAVLLVGVIVIAHAQSSGASDEGVDR